MAEPSIINNERGFSPVLLSATVTPLPSHLKSEKKNSQNAQSINFIDSKIV